MDLGKITFNQSYADGNTITHTIRGDSSLDEVLEAFEHFLKGAGYHLPEGCHIGYEYDEDSQENDRSQDEFHIEVGDFGAAQPIYTDYAFADSGVEEMGHSKYYYDKDRNR